MKEKFFVEGANFTASIMIDTSIHSNPYMEAATQVMEMLYGHGPDSELADEFEIFINKGDTEASIGLAMLIYKDGDKNNEEKEKWVLSAAVARNVGFPELVKNFTESLKKYGGS